MSNRSLGARVQEQLTQAVESHLLPSSVQEKAEHLLSRLQKPVRIALLGRPGSGKSTLLNLLVGAIVLPPDTPFPTLQLSYGETPQSVVTLADGSKQTVDHADGDKIAAMSPAFVEMQMPLAALTKISLLEVVTPDDPTALQRASQWASKRCEVAIWCTQSFSKIEQSLWSEMPDIIKDHGFLMLTKADFLRANNMLDQTLDGINMIARDEFAHIMPIATKQAIAARRPNKTVDKDLMRSSGGTALISAVLKQVDMGRQTAVDMADILLHQHADVLAPILSPEAADAAPTPKPEREPAEIETAIDATVAETETAAPQPDAAAAKIPAVEEPVAESNIVTLHPASREAYEAAVAYIIEQSRALIAEVDNIDDGGAATIIAKAVEHVQWISDHLNENGDDADAALQIARDAAMDAADLVQLMQMEKRDSAAIEALSLLLQLKHELQADLAA